jgi:hypothetical protein
MTRIGPSDPRMLAGCELLRELVLPAGVLVQGSMTDFDGVAVRLLGIRSPLAIVSKLPGIGTEVDGVESESRRGAIDADGTLATSVLGRNVTPCPQVGGAIAVSKGAASSHPARMRPFSGQLVNFRLDGLRIFPAP